MPTVAKLAAIKAMDGLYLRASAIAENIANANSQSFHLKSVDFEGELRKAVLAGPQALAQFAPRMTSAMSPVGGDDIRLDLEMAGASATALRYNALSDILNRQMQLTRLAVKGGQ